MTERKKYRVDAEKFKAARKRAALTVEELSKKAIEEMIKAVAETKANELWNREREGRQFTSLDEDISARRKIYERVRSEIPSDETRGFSVSDIQKYEKGGAFIYADKLKILMPILNVRPEEIIFFDEPGRFTDTVQFKTWRYFVDDIFRNSSRGYGLYLYGNYRTFVDNCCKSSWDALSTASSTASRTKEKTPAQQNTIYAATRKIGLKKKDFLETSEILAALAFGKDEAVFLSTKDHHIAEIFKRNISKHQSLLQVLKEQAGQGKIEYQYSITEIKQLNDYFTTLTESIDRAKQHAEIEKEELFRDMYGYGDQAEYYRELHEELTYAELDNL